MKSEHTPGPWKMVRSGRIVKEPTRTSIGGVICTIANHSHPQSRANARLIALAPEMYSALKALIEGDSLNNFCKKHLEKAL